MTDMFKSVEEEEEEEEHEYREAANLTEAFLDCARYNDGEDARTLLEHLSMAPTLIEARDEMGRTAVHLAAANGHMEILAILMEFGPHPDVPNHEGNTALHFAALNNQVGAAHLLLARGWHASQRNAFGKTPIQLIYGKQFEKMEMLLLEQDDELECCGAGVEGVDEMPKTTALAEEQAAAVVSLAPEGSTHEKNNRSSQFSNAPRSSGETSSHNGAPISPAPRTNPTLLLGSADVEGIE